MVQQLTVLAALAENPDSVPLHALGSWQPSASPILINPVPSSASMGTACPWCTDMHVGKHSYT